MPSVRKKTNKTGQVFYEIRVSRGRGQSYLTSRWYPPEGWSQRAIDRELARQAAEFERRVKAGEVVSRVERAAQEAEAARLAAQIKTVRQYADEIFLPAKSLTLAENTRSLYEMFLRRHILPAIGDFRMQEVTPAMLTKTIFNFQKIGAAHSSVLTLHVVLHGLFEMAALDGTIELSPMGKVKRPARPKDERADEAEKALTAERLAYVLDCAANEPLKWQTYIVLAADTGARRGELCGLQWQDIDWKGGVIHIERNLQYSPREGVYLTLPKTGKRARCRCWHRNAGASPPAAGGSGFLMRQPMGFHTGRDSGPHVPDQPDALLPAIRREVWHPGLPPASAPALVRLHLADKRSGSEISCGAARAFRRRYAETIRPRDPRKHPPRRTDRPGQAERGIDPLLCLFL